MDYKYYFFSLLIGVLVGYGELVSRYLDEPKKIFSSLSAIAYMLVNGIASVVAFKLLNVYGPQFLKINLDPLNSLMIAGFSSMLFLRSSLFTLKMNNQDTPIGPAALLTIIMSAADRLFDRERAKDRAKTIVTIMKDVDFEKSKLDLPLLCLSLMQNLSIEEQKRLGDEVLKLSTPTANSNKTKSIVLGLMFRLLSERLTQIEAGWTKPLRVTIYGISKDV